MNKYFWNKMMIWMPRAPFYIKMFLCKMLKSSLKDMENDIVLFNELNLWIDSSGRPQTSNPNYVVNKINSQDLKQ